MQERNESPNAAALEAAVREGLGFWGVPGAGVAVVHGEEEFYVRGHGVRDLHTGEPVTPETLFGIASTTKAFTTAGLAMLMDEGKLAWDDPVRKHLPWFRLADPLAGAQVTVRDLVTHRTGLARNDMGWTVWDYRGRKVLSHGGAIDGFRSTVCLVPALKLGIAVLVNAGPTRMHEALRNTFLDLLLWLPPKDWNGLFKDLQDRAEAEEQERKAEREAKRHRGTRPSRELAAYAGTYHDDAYGTAEVSLEDKDLVLRWSSFRFPLAHWHYDTFAAHDREAEVETQVTFGLNADREVEKLCLYGAELRKQRSDK